jgi:nicotinamidase/pyrazinamidase
VPRAALLVVDVQNDFCPGGALPVPEGDRVVPVLNRYIERFRAAGAPVLASRDWHPPETRHFVSGGGPWPPHCVRGTRGAAFHPDLALPEGAVIVTKGTDPADDGYSAFEGTDPDGRPLGGVLDARGVDRLYIGGLATDYCVRATALDGLRAGLDVVLLLDAVRGIDAEPGDVARAIDGLVRAGARTGTLETVAAELGGEGPDGA